MPRYAIILKVEFEETNETTRNNHKFRNKMEMDCQKRFHKQIIFFYLVAHRHIYYILIPI